MPWCPTLLVPEPSVSDPQALHIREGKGRIVALYIVNSIFRMTFLTQFVLPVTNLEANANFFWLTSAQKCRWTSMYWLQHLSHDLPVSPLFQSSSCKLWVRYLHETENHEFHPHRRYIQGENQHCACILCGTLSFMVLETIPGPATCLWTLFRYSVLLLRRVRIYPQCLLTRCKILDSKKKINKSDYPGKILFVEAMRKIVLLSQLLSWSIYIQLPASDAGAQTLIAASFQTRLPLMIFLMWRHWSSWITTGRCNFILCQDRWKKRRLKIIFGIWSRSGC